MVVEDGHLAALAHDQDAVAHGQHLRQVRADEDDRHAPRRQIVDQLMDLHLGADVDTTSRFVEDHHFGVRLQPLADDDLLLVAPGKRRRRRIDRRRADAQPLPEGLGGRPLLRTAHDSGGRQKAGERRQRDVRRDRERHDESELSPVLGAIGDAQRHGVAGTATRSPELRRARSRRRPRGRSRRAPARRRCAGLRPDRQTRAPPRRGGRTRHPETRPRGADRAPTAAPRPDRAARGGTAPDLATDHAADGSCRRQLRARRGRDPAAVAQDRDAIGDLEDFFHTVGDEKNRHALLAQGVHDAEEPLHLVRREGCRRLVHDQHAHVERDRLGDLDRLLFGEGQPAGRLADVEPHVEPAEDLTAPRVPCAAGRRSCRDHGGR